MYISYICYTEQVAYPLLIGPRVKKQLRLGVPHPYRRVVWLRLSGAEESCRGDYDGYYEATLRLCLKLDRLPADGSYPTIEGKFPTFGGQLVQYEWLTEEHLEAAKRLLLTLKQFEAKMNYCPMLPAVLCALLQALSEAEVYAVVLALVDRSLQSNTQPKLPHFQLTQQQEIIFEMTFYDIAASYASAAVKALKVHLPAYPPEKDGEDDFWDAWKHSFFCNKLPLQSVLKIVDIWMSEGHKAIFRVALALLNEHTEQLVRASDRVDAMDLLCPITPLATRVPVNDNRLLSQAFKLSLSRKQLQSLDKANEDKAGVVVSLRPAATNFHKPRWSLHPIVVRMMAPLNNNLLAHFCCALSRFELIIRACGVLCRRTCSHPAFCRRCNWRHCGNCCHRHSRRPRHSCSTRATAMGTRCRGCSSNVIGPTVTR